MQFKEIIFTIIVVGLLYGCSSDDPVPGCFQEEGRRIVQTINEATGTIIGSRCDGKTFLIQPDKEEHKGPLGQFAPCNLTTAFQVDAARVIFNGYVYESFDNEDICADFFEITELRMIVDGQ